MAEKSYKLEIVTPEKKVYSETVEFSVFPGAEGELGIMPNHAPLVSRLIPGKIKITKGNSSQYLTTSSGFLEVKNNEVSVIVETAEFVQEKT